MSDLRFTFRGDDDQVASRDQPRFGAPGIEASDPTGGSLGPLYLSRPGGSPPRRPKRRFPLIVASVVTFLLAAGGAAAVLGPPAALQPMIRSAVDRFGAGAEPPPLVAERAPEPLPPIEPHATVESAAAEAALEASTMERARPSEVPIPPPGPEAKAAPDGPAKALPRTSNRPKPTRASKAAAPALDLDALERSLP